MHGKHRKQTSGSNQARAEISGLIRPFARGADNSLLPCPPRSIFRHDRAHESGPSIASSDNQTLLLNAMKGMPDPIRLHVRRAATRSGAAARERARLGRELHDGIVQDLMAVDLELETALRDHGQSPQELSRTIRLVQGRLRASTVNMRRLIETARASDVSPAQLPATIEEAVWRFARETKIAATYAAHLEGVAIRLPRRVCGELVSVVREALVNVARHSGAANVAVELGHDARHFKLTITDDGRGFAVNCPPSVIRERLQSVGGRVRLEMLAHGSRLEISIPREAPWKEVTLSASS